MLEQLYEDAENAGPDQQKAARKKLENAPPLSPDDSYFWQIYHELGTMRPQGMGFARIPLKDIWLYAEHRGFTPDETEELEQIITRVDAKHCRIVGVKAKKQ